MPPVSPTFAMPVGVYFECRLSGRLAAQFDRVQRQGAAAS